jgi:phage terminase small subunit
MSKKKPKKTPKVSMSNHTPELNPQQRLFCLYYLKLNFNATQAAIDAGYSEKTAHSQACRLLKNPHILKYIEEAMREREEAVKLDAQYVLTRLGEQTEADFADIFDDDNNLKDFKNWPKIWRQGLISGLERCPLTKKVIKIRITDRTKILELLGKHVKVKAFSDKLEIEGDLLKGIEITFVKAEPEGKK